VGLHVILRHALAVVVQNTEVVLGIGIALFGERLHFTERNGVVTPVVGRDATPKIGGPLHCGIKTGGPLRGGPHHCGIAHLGARKVN